MAVTGAAAGLGRALVERLDQRDGLGAVRGIDVVTAERLRGVDAVVHLATSYDIDLDPQERRALNVRGTEALLTAASAAGVRRVVLVTSAEVYGAAADNPVPLPDAGPLQAAPGPDLLGDHVEIERLISRTSGLQIAVLRPATLVGAGVGPSYDGALLRQLSAPRLLAARGREPLWQLCHSEDLLSALELVVVHGLSGPLPVACEGALPQSAVEKLAGKRRVELPAAVALSTAERLHRLGVSTASPRELDHLVGPVVVGCDRLRAAGWTPSWTNEAALRAYLTELDSGSGRAGAYTAAGATVALLGTAALVRQARRRRRGL